MTATYHRRTFARHPFWCPLVKFLLRRDWCMCLYHGKTTSEWRRR